MIGVFDSGDGGLTVLKALVARLPEQDFLYLGDNGRAPYGGRDPEEIYRFTLAGVDCLFARGCRLVLLACNTAAAIALRRLQQNWLEARDAELGNPGRRVLGVLVPMVEAVAQVPWHETAGSTDRPQDEPSSVAVFATRRTVESGAYPLEIGLRSPQVEVIQQACPDLVARIEAGAADAELAGTVRNYVTAMLAQVAGQVPDRAVLGCTHYPLVARAFREALPESVELLDQPTLVAASLTDYLRRHPEFGGGTGEAGQLKFLTSGSTQAASDRASRFFGRSVSFESCEF